MGYAEDIARLRQEGASDDDILDTYRELAPHDSADIEKLRGEGATAKDILDTIADMPLSPKPQANPQANEGILEKSRKALQYGTAQGIKGLGATYRHLGGGKNALETYGEAFGPKDYKPASMDFFDPQGEDKGIGGYGWGYLPRMMLESVPGLATDLGIGALTGGAGFIASNASRNFGPTLDERVKNNGGREASVGDYAAAAGSTALQAYLNKIGALGGKIPGVGSAIEGAGNSVLRGAGLEAAKRIPGVLGRAAVTEGVTEAAQNVIDQAGTTIGTDKGLSIDPHQVGGAAIAGGAMGGALRATTLPGDAINAYRHSGTDQDSNIRVADRFKGLDNKITDSSEQYRALKTVEDSIKTSIGVSEKAADWLIKQSDAERTLGDITSTLKRGDGLTPEQTETLKSVLGQHEDGIRLLEDLTDYSTLNRVKRSGSNSELFKSFDGGLTGKFGAFLNPRLLPGKLMGAGASGLGAASAFELPFYSQLGIAGPFLAKALATQSALYAGAKGIDAVTGQSNPVARFRDQFAGLDQSTRAPVESALMSPREAQEAAGATREADGNQRRIDRAAEAAVRQSAADTTKGIKRYRDLENQLAGIEQGASDANAKEIAAEASRKAKETDAAWKAHEASRNADTASPALSDRLWAPLDRSLPAAASAESLWSTQERNNVAEAKARAAADAQADAELQAAEAARAELAARHGALAAELRATENRAEMDARTQADAEASRKAKETDKAWAEYLSSQNAQGPSPALSDRLWAPQEAPKVDPKAKQTEDLWSKAEDAENSPDWNETDAQGAISRAYQDRESAIMKAFAGKKPEKAEKPKKDKAAPKDAPKEAVNDDSPVDTITVRVGDSTVTRPRQGIKNEKAYKASMIGRMTKRSEAIDEARPIIQTRQQDLDALLDRLNNSSSDGWQQAQSHIEDFITANDDIDLQSKLWDWYNANEGKLKGTYDR